MNKARRVRSEIDLDEIIPHSSRITYHGIIRRMTTKSRRAKILSRLPLGVWLDGLIAACLAVLGIGGVVLVVRSFHPYSGVPVADANQAPYLVVTEPNVPVLGLFMLALGLGMIGVAWFIVRLVHWRFFAPVKARRVWRQSIFIGLFVVGSAWLKINQAFSIPLAGTLLLALVLIEVYLNVRAVKSDE